MSLPEQPLGKKLLLVAEPTCPGQSLLHSLTNDKILDQCKLKTVADDNLTHYQTTNFRLFQIERLCRRQFKI